MKRLFLVKERISMKFVQKNICIIFFSIVLITIALYPFTEKSQCYPAFCVDHQNQTNTHEISIFDAKDGNFYVFLPSYADLEEVFVVLKDKHAYSLGNIDLTDRMTCGLFELEQPYDLFADHCKIGNLTFYRASNIAAMYIDTVSGTMKAIHEDKEHKEYASLALYTADGDMDFSNHMITLKGRGNTSWSRDKKSYTITLPQSAALLQMGTSKQWVLNSNGFDASNLHNKIVYEFADSVAKQDSWAPDCEYVEVYFNGTFAGLYLLCQKIDAGEDHLNLNADDYLFELTFSSRLEGIPSAFWISNRRSGEIITPKNVDDNQKNYLQTYVGDFQTALFSDTGVHDSTGLAWSDYIDMDSWARKYLVEEVFANFDAGQGSQFYWLDASEQKLYAGPCWDYDLTFGQFWETDWTTPQCLLAQRNWEDDQSWHHVLCKKDDFMDAVVKMYATEFRPLLQIYIQEIIGNTAAEIENAVLLDRTRWPSIYSETEFDAAAAGMIGYLRERMEFLDSLWLDEVDFCTITLQTAGEVYNICVPTGTIGTAIPETSAFGASGSWRILETDDLFDVTQPINTDLTLVVQTS